jgi:hypothetical protein
MGSVASAICSAWRRSADRRSACELNGFSPTSGWPIGMPERGCSMHIGWEQSQFQIHPHILIWWIPTTYGIKTSSTPLSGKIAENAQQKNRQHSLKKIFNEPLSNHISKEGSCHTVISMGTANARSCDVTRGKTIIVVDYTIILEHCEQCFDPFMLLAAWIFINHMWHHNSEQWLPPWIWQTVWQGPSFKHGKWICAWQSSLELKWIHCPCSQ